MLRTYAIHDGRITETPGGPILVYVAPDEAERRFLVDSYRIDEHTLASALDPDAPDRVLRERALEALEEGEAVAAWATYFARRMHRLAERRRPLMGPLLDRLPQELGTS